MNKYDADSVAFVLHEAWRKTRLLPDGTYSPRWKTIKDEKYIEYLKKTGKMPEYVRINNDGVYEIDIANACYSQLSADWQEENKRAALVVVALCDRYQKGELTLDQVGYIIHEAWLERNPWAKDGELGVPFSELSKEEQDKDLVQFKIAYDMHIARKEEISAGVSLESVAMRLEQAKIRGENIYVEFNGTKLYSLYDDMDTCFLKVTGLTKAKHDRELADYTRKRKEEKVLKLREAKAKMPVYYERGKKIIYSAKWNDWYRCVESRVEDVYYGKELDVALQIMEKLANGESVEEAAKVFDGIGISGAAEDMALNIVLNFSKRGVEFYRGYKENKLTEEEELMLTKIEKANEIYAKMERKPTNGDTPDK